MMGIDVPAAGMVQELSKQLAEVTRSRNEAFRREAAAWAALAEIPGYPHIRTAPDPVTGDASLAVNIRHLAAELTEAKDQIADHEGWYE